MTTTQNLHLPQWEETDRIHHDDFNAAMAAIDTAIAAAGNCKIATGTYTGAGECGEDHPTALTLNFVPKLLIICGDSYYGFLIGGASFAFSIGIDVGFNLGGLAVTWNGSSVSWYCSLHYDETSCYPPTAQHQLSSNNATYRYVAIG